MKRLGVSIFLLFGAFLGAQEAPSDAIEMSQEKEFIVNLSNDKKQVIHTLVQKMGKYKTKDAIWHRKSLKKLGRQTRGISGTQFLGYIFEHPNLVRDTKKISKKTFRLFGYDSMWEAFSKGIRKQLAKEAETTLFEDLSAFAKHTGADENTLRHLALDGKWNEFILHLLEKY
ncbi:MAG: hypothetical protein SP4CHLAM5_06030 [Chlamydiia bacterium]|nr:hypothetical protein [Chlamydiia bacterium]MCH9618472.1 hypothetical protein [Chlamydiia bacterium]MCH9623934.1 hypothetical protein [Chlamydiia bacterium]